MPSIEPKDPSRLNGADIEYEGFSCCGNEELIFLKCPNCNHVWVECIECSTWYVDLQDLDRRESSFLASNDHRLACHACDAKFADFYYLANENCDKYLPTAADVVAAGHQSFLSDEGRARPEASVASMTGGTGKTKAASAPVLDSGTYSSMLGGSIGAAGWVLGIGFVCFTKGFWNSGVVAMVMALAIVMVGFYFLHQVKNGRRTNALVGVQTMLLASGFFGLLALLYCKSQGTWSPIVDPNDEYPVIFDFAAPIMIAVMFVLVSVTPVKTILQRMKIPRPH